MVHRYTIKRMELQDSQLHSLQFQNLVLSEFKIKNSTCRFSNFNDSQIFLGNFSGCDLSNSTFRGTNLNGAYFTYCDLSNCDFTNASMLGTTFYDCKLNNIKYSTVHEPYFSRSIHSSSPHPLTLDYLRTEFGLTPP